MKSIDELIGLIAESEELCRRLAEVQNRIGKLGAPESADLGGGEEVFMRLKDAGKEGGGAQGCDTAPLFYAGR